MKGERVAFFRADGSKDIGMGHLKRAALLAEMVNRVWGMKVKLFLKSNELAAGFLSKGNLVLENLPEDVSPAEEKNVLAKHIEREKPALVFVDVLEHDRDSAYMQVFRRSGSLVTAITDDSSRRVIDADIVVNGNPLQQGQDYSRETARYLCGAAYFLMDPAYARVQAGAPKESVQKILLTPGGSDHGDLLFKALAALEKIHGRWKILIVTSRATGYLDRLRSYLSSLSLDTELAVDVESLVTLWPSCDLAITAGGNTLFERIAARLPGATICQLPRQMEIADAFSAAGVNVNLGFGPDLDENAMVRGLQDFLSAHEIHQTQYRQAPEVLDGKGLFRLEREIKIMLEEKDYGL